MKGAKILMIYAKKRTQNIRTLYSTNIFTHKHIYEYIYIYTNMYPYDIKTCLLPNCWNLVLVFVFLSGFSPPKKFPQLY